MAETTKKPRKRKKNDTGWGGKREGAGRPKGEKSPHNTMLPFRVTAITAERIKQLRELTKQDTMPFVEMFEAWVADMAQDYGIE